jgi:uncharacterized protein
MDKGLLAVFLTGLLTGGLTCLAVQGGLLAATLAQRAQDALTDKAQKTGNAIPILAFLSAKLFAYTLLGFFLGWVGSLIQPSQAIMIILQIAVGLFMIATALNILNVHPIFRYAVIQPPRFLTRMIRKESKSGNVFAPVMLGAFTVFIPCGTTQAMMALAVASGSPGAGAAVLFAFTLGTSPVFFLLGYFATKLSATFQRTFMQFAAYAIILLAVFNINNTIALTGSPWTLDRLWSGFYCTVSFCASDFKAEVTQAASDTTIYIKSEGYSPNQLTVKAGTEVNLKLINNDGNGCAQAFTMPTLGIQRIVPIGKTDEVHFTAPTTPGEEIAFMCSMGMYRGTIHVI